MKQQCPASNILSEKAVPMIPEPNYLNNLWPDTSQAMLPAQILMGFKIDLLQRTCIQDAQTRSKCRHQWISYYTVYLNET